MSLSKFHIRIALLGAVLVAAAGSAMAESAALDAPTGEARPMAEHRSPYIVPRSTLPPATPMAGATESLGVKYSGTPIDVLTYHYDNYRTGWNSRETKLTPAWVKSDKFGLLTTIAVDGNVLAQPLLVSGFVMPDKTSHDVLIIATGHDTVYAFDAGNYKLLWQVSLGTPQNSNDVGCGDVVPEYGIDSTPVIVRTAANAATIYVVSATEPKSFQFHHTLHALDLATGKDLQAPVEIAPKARLAGGSLLAFDPQNQYIRSSLAYNNGTVYLGITSHCDANQDSISGWVLSYSSALKLQHFFHTIATPTPGSIELASIWMTGFAPAIDPSGDVFVVTGNGAFNNPGHDWGESVLKLSSVLLPLDRFTDSNYQSLNGSDSDLGSGGIMLLPEVSGQAAPPMGVAIGKSSDLYLLNQNSLGRLAPNNRGALQAQHVNGGGVWGGPAYYAGPTGQFVYVQTGFAPLIAYKVSASQKPSLTAGVEGATAGGFGGSLPIVSSNGAVANTAIVWLIRRTDPLELEAYDALKLGMPLFSANVGSWSNKSGHSYLTPMEANGRVYVPNYKTVSVFGLD